MIQIIKNLPPSPEPKIERVEIKDAVIDINHYYGVRIRDVVGFVTRPKYESGEFDVHCLNAVTNGNRLCGFTKSDLKGLIQIIINENGEVFVFTTANELAKWLYESSVNVDLV